MGKSTCTLGSSGHSLSERVTFGGNPFYEQHTYRLKNKYKKPTLSNLSLIFATDVHVVAFFKQATSVTFPLIVLQMQILGRYIFLFIDFDLCVYMSMNFKNNKKMIYLGNKKKSCLLCRTAKK